MEVNMFTGRRRFYSVLAMSIMLLGVTAIGMASNAGKTNPAGSNKQPLSVTEQVRHKLGALDYLSVFDNLSFAITNSDTVILDGQVIRPTLKTDAEAAVRGVSGISKVVNNIEVMPLSPFDDSIRLRTYRAIYSRGGFERYALQAQLPIRIIVKNGNVTLEGMVGNRLDKTMAEMAARSVPGAFSVTDNLTIG
jgi:hyperosmotically inducible periplasmic protein